MQKSNIFEEKIEISPSKAQLRRVETRNSGISSILSHYDPGKSHNIAEKPNSARINTTNTQKSKKDLYAQANVYKARRNTSEIIFN